VNTALALVVMAAITWPELLVQQHPAFEWLRVEVVIPTHASSHPVVRTDMYPGLCCSVLCSGLSCVQASSSLVSNTIRGAAVATTTATEAAGPWRATAAVHLTAHAMETASLCAVVTVRIASMPSHPHHPIPPKPIDKPGMHSYLACTPWTSRLNSLAHTHTNGLSTKNTRKQRKSRSTKPRAQSTRKGKRTTSAKHLN
jgi:hypothetical protein